MPALPLAPPPTFWPRHKAAQEAELHTEADLEEALGRRPSPGSEQGSPRLLQAFQQASCATFSGWDDGHLPCDLLLCPPSPPDLTSRPPPTLAPASFFWSPGSCPLFASPCGAHCPVCSPRGASLHRTGICHWSASQQLRQRTWGLLPCPSLEDGALSTPSSFPGGHSSVSDPCSTNSAPGSQMGALGCDYSPHSPPRLRAPFLHARHTPQPE